MPTLVTSTSEVPSFTVVDSVTSVPTWARTFTLVVGVQLNGGGTLQQLVLRAWPWKKSRVDALWLARDGPGEGKRCRGRHGDGRSREEVEDVMTGGGGG